LVEKARWGRSVITKGKKSNFLKRLIKLTLVEVQEMIAKTPAKKKWLLKSTS
jgi:DNA topoisomerase-1